LKRHALWNGATRAKMGTIGRQGPFREFRDGLQFTKVAGRPGRTYKRVRGAEF
jgi:hypothetical protein